MYALTILSFDSDFSKNDQKMVWLIEMHEILLQALITLFNITEATFEQRVGIALYFENLKRLPDHLKKTILGEMGVPQVETSKSPKISRVHRQISEGLKRKFWENRKDFIVVDGESGLDSGILPMEITIKDGTGKRIAFVEIDGPNHYITLEDGQVARKRRDQLKEELYKFNQPGVPLMRIDLAESKRQDKKVTENIYQKISSFSNEKS
jgi:hypothetical protein